MASCLQVENLTKSYGEQVLFENISFTIEEGRRVALVAKNGTGKTTLLNIIAGKESHDAGSVVPRRGLRIAYLEQSPAYPAGMTVLEACFHSESPALKAIAEYERAIGDASGEGLQEAMARMDALEAWDYEQRAKRILSRLRIRDFGQKVETLSGGQLKRVALANVLISESDLLILDEPTNHLDTDMTEWLEEYLPAGAPPPRGGGKRTVYFEFLYICVSYAGRRPDYFCGFSLFLNVYVRPTLSSVRVCTSRFCARL